MAGKQTDIENLTYWIRTSFVLRRESRRHSTAVRTDQPGIRLTFENRPITLPPSWIKDAPTKKSIYFQADRLHNGGNVIDVSLWQSGLSVRRTRTAVGVCEFMAPPRGRCNSTAPS